MINRITDDYEMSVLNKASIVIYLWTDIRSVKFNSPVNILKKYETLRGIQRGELRESRRKVILLLLLIYLYLSRWIWIITKKSILFAQSYVYTYTTTINVTFEFLLLFWINAHENIENDEGLIYDFFSLNFITPCVTENGFVFFFLTKFRF